MGLWWKRFAPLKKRERAKCVLTFIASTAWLVSLSQIAAAANYTSATYYGYQEPIDRFSPFVIMLVLAIIAAAIGGFIWLMGEMEREAHQRRAAAAQRQEYLNSPEYLDQEAIRLRAQKRHLEAQAELELMQAQLEDQRKFFKKNALGK